MMQIEQSCWNPFRFDLRIDGQSSPRTELNQTSTAVIRVRIDKKVSKNFWNHLRLSWVGNMP